MKKSIKKWQIIALSLVLFTTSCNPDDDKPYADSIGGKKDILIGTFLQNNSGNIGAAYMQLISSIDPKSVDNKQAIPTTSPSFVIGDEIYSLPGWTGTSNVCKKYKIKNGEIVEQAVVQLPAGSGANGIAINSEKIYIAYSFLGKIGVYDRSNFTHLKDIDITSYGIGDQNPDPAHMIIREGILYVALNQIVGSNHVPDPARAVVDVLIIDTKTDDIKKMIAENSSGMSMPTKPDANRNAIFMDENQDIYISCVSGFGFVGHKAGFLRIKNGEEDFDTSYAFDITSTAIQGESNMASYLTEVVYAGNGKVYATVDIPAYYSTPQPNWLEDKTILPVELDLYSKTIRRLGSAKSTNYGTSVGTYHENIVFGLTTANSNGFFVYDTQNQKLSEEAMIKTEGHPMFFEEIN